MNIQEALNYINSIPPFIPRQVKEGEEIFNLEKVAILLERLGNPQNQLKFVHVAGTNGKGSTCAYIERILRESGYRTGLYTSPAIERFAERIRVNGEEIGDASVCKHLEPVKRISKEMEEAGEGWPSEFEQVLALAFLYFVEQKCDIVVLEVGLGGRLDATNVIPAPEVCVFTPISFDHTEILGDTLTKIASEKSGIIKDGASVVIYPQEREVTDTLEKVCSSFGIDAIYSVPAMDCHLKSYIERKQGQEYVLRNELHQDRVLSQTRLVRQFKVRETIYETTLLGSYQPQNAATAITAAHVLQDLGYSQITEASIQKGVQNTIWPGRFELLHADPVIIVDGGHNPQGGQALASSIRDVFPEKKVRFVTGVLGDKDYPSIFKSVLPLAVKFYCIAPNSPRALPADDLAAYLKGQEAKAESFDSVDEALQAAMKEVSENEIICVFGSLYFVGEARKCVMDITEK